MRWLTKYNQATRRTKNFVLTCIIYGLVLIISTVYCYVRIDLVRESNQHESGQSLINKN